MHSSEQSMRLQLFAPYVHLKDAPHEPGDTGAADAIGQMDRQQLQVIQQVILSQTSSHEF